MTTQDSRKVIAVIDDDITTRTFLKFYLDAYGYQTFVANDWSEGRLLLEYLSPDLLIVDGLLPDFMGTDICSAIRKRPDKRELPIILLTSFFKRGRSANFVQETSGADLLIHKPVEQWLLLQSVAGLIGDVGGDPESRQVLTPDQYESSRKTYLMQLRDFDSVLRSILERLDQRKLIAADEWLLLLKPFYKRVHDFSPHGRKTDVDVEHCESLLHQVTLQLFSQQGIPLRDVWQKSLETISFSNPQVEGPMQ